MNESSVIAIDEKVLPDTKEDWAEEYTAGLSLWILAVFQALERKGRQWRKLLREAGLEIREIKRLTEDGDAVIMAGKKTMLVDNGLCFGGIIKISASSND